MHSYHQPLPPAPRAHYPDDIAGAAAMFDPALLKAARHIYRTYYEVHPDDMQRPMGVAINRKSRRGKLIFSGPPVLLPSECFVPLEQIEPDIH
ncbi:hypothetical protein [Halomicronema sp. CCY15110]|uniref:hypothetical protein n=1 Tax=Halomicronema sp. CCY15110 TaxID=2767773 RepID=UPI002814C213|nr:hypothetical protein [Halomicronema sp. CCY15110]